MPANKKTFATKSATATVLTTPPERPAPVRPSIVTEITDEMIAKRAYEIWCGKGKPWGGENDNWKQAQSELTRELGFAAAPAPSRANRADTRA